jgi:hypothetical protein
MKALDFVEGLKEIIEGMEINQLLSLADRWLAGASSSAPVPNQIHPNQQPLSDQDKNLFSELVFKSHAGYFSLLRSETTRKILEGLNVKAFYEPSLLRLLVANTSTFSQMGQLRQIPELFSFFEKLKSLRAVYATSQSLLEIEKVGTVEPSKGIVELELIEYADEDGVSAKRMTVFVSTIDELHMSLAIVLGTPTDALTFKYLDSGSSFLVALQCLKPIAETLNTLLNQWWDKFRFWRFDTFEKRMAAIEEGLTVADTVRQAIEKGTITQEEGANLKLRILRGVDNLIGIGATVPLREDATVDQRQLLTDMRNTKLLGSGQPSDDKPKGDGGIDEDPGRSLRVVD